MLRWLAAVGVFLFHAGSFIAPWITGVARDQGSECVAVFFVLSGFVIRFVSVEKETDWKSYLSARAARLYSVVILAIAATLAADAIGTRINPSFYHGTDWFNSVTTIWDIISYLTFTNQLWYRNIVVGSGQPYWSLGFEAAYYLMFAAAIYAKGWKRFALLVLWATICGPKIIAGLPVWLIGVVTYEVTRSSVFKPKYPKLVGAALMIASGALYLLNKYKFWTYGAGAIFNPRSAQDLIHSAGYMAVVGIAVAINFIGFDLIARSGFRWPRSFSKIIKWLAGGSFTLYLVHEPILAMLRAIYPSVTDKHVLGIVAMLTAFAVTLLLAEFGERRKLFFRRILP